MERVNLAKELDYTTPVLVPCSTSSDVVHGVHILVRLSVLRPAPATIMRSGLTSPCTTWTWNPFPWEALSGLTLLLPQACL